MKKILILVLGIFLFFSCWEKKVEKNWWYMTNEDFKEIRNEITDNKYKNKVENIEEKKEKNNQEENIKIISDDNNTLNVEKLLIDTFFKDKKLSWENIYKICTYVNLENYIEDKEIDTISNIKFPMFLRIECWAYLINKNWYKNNQWYSTSVLISESDWKYFILENNFDNSKAFSSLLKNNFSKEQISKMKKTTYAMSEDNLIQKLINIQQKKVDKILKEKK